VSITLVIFVVTVTWPNVNGFGEDCTKNSTICTGENEECRDYLETKTCQCVEGYPVIVNGKCAKGVSVKRLTPSKPGDDCTSTKKCNGLNQECKDFVGDDDDSDKSSDKKKTCQCHSDYPVIREGKCTKEEIVSTEEKDSKNDEL